MEGRLSVLPLQHSLPSFTVCLTNTHEEELQSPLSSPSCPILKAITARNITPSTCMHSNSSSHQPIRSTLTLHSTPSTLLHIITSPSTVFACTPLHRYTVALQHHNTLITSQLRLKDIQCERLASTTCHTHCSSTHKHHPVYETLPTPSVPVLVLLFTHTPSTTNVQFAFIPHSQ
ncbi:hypothetical protein TcWFU_005175 [Taenia crassiceps]|uniref:Uncharacterized protein n=1 Tax=Taenia crassiceps TaxID=6207 RepID=A0ABR4Q067_9CEST